MKEIELLKIIFKDSPDILEPLNEIDKEIERLNNIIKEVREYIKKQVHRNQQFYEMDIENILEILDYLKSKGDK